MNSFLKRCVCVGAAAMLAVTGLSGCGKLDGTKTVATCNDEAIPLGVASLMVRYQQMQIGSYYSSLFGTSGGMFDTVSNEETGETYGDTIKTSIMDSLEEMYIVSHHASDYDVAVTDDEKTEMETAAQTYMDSNDQEVLDKVAASKEDVQKLLELYTIQNKMRKAMTADVDREVSDEEAAKSKITYVSFNLTTTDENNETVDMDDAAKAEQMTKAEQVLAKLQEQDDIAGADMGALTKEVDSNLSATSPSFAADDTTVDDAVKAAVDGLEDGSLVNSVVTSSDGKHYYVVRLDAAFDRESTDANKETIISQREDDAYKALYDQWKEAATFSINDKVWDQVDVTDKDTYQYKTTDTAENTTEENAAPDDTAADDEAADNSAAQ
ncbi:MAG: hypothetical protein PHS82_10630 [Lachnospiraceae bacterium]|nr:hypothetical protein [Lachnospiraceae bacterium]